MISYNRNQKNVGMALVYKEHIPTHMILLVSELVLQCLKNKRAFQKKIYCKATQILPFLCNYAAHKAKPKY